VLSHKVIDEKYLKDHPNHIFVFGDNIIRYGKGGAAKLRGEPNTYGFVTKKYPSNEDTAFFRPDEYTELFSQEKEKLENMIKSNPDKIFLISKIGSGLANKYHIWENVIEHQIKELSKYNNVEFLFKGD